MRTQNINIVSYDKKWKDEFNKISAELEKALGKTALKIEHVGSTSVEGMASKPIIDVDIVVENDEKVKEAIEKYYDKKAIFRTDNSNRNENELIYLVSEGVMKKAEKKKGSLNDVLQKIQGVIDVNMVSQNNEMNS